MNYKYAVTFIASGSTQDVEATSPRRAVWKVARTMGSLGMIDAIQKDTDWDDVFVIRGTSGAVHTVRVTRIPPVFTVVRTETDGRKLTQRTYASDMGDAANVVANHELTVVEETPGRMVYQEKHSRATITVTPEREPGVYMGSAERVGR